MSLQTFERHLRCTCLRLRTDGAAPLVSFFVYRTRRFFVCVACPCSFLTKCHINLCINNNNNNNDMSLVSLTDRDLTNEELFHRAEMQTRNLTDICEFCEIKLTVKSVAHEP